MLRQSMESHNVWRVNRPVGGAVEDFQQPTAADSDFVFYFLLLQGMGMNPTRSPHRNDFLHNHEKCKNAHNNQIYPDRMRRVASGYDI